MRMLDLFSDYVKISDLRLLHKHMSMKALAKLNIQTTNKQA